MEEQTHGRIAEILPAGALTADQGLVLASAVYFRATWAHTFRKEVTRDADFIVSATEKVKVPMMEQTELARALPRRGPRIVRNVPPRIDRGSVRGSLGTSSKHES